LTSHGDLYPLHPLPKPDTEVTPIFEPWTRNIAPMIDSALKNLAGFKPVDDRDIEIRFQLTMKALRELGEQMREVTGRKNLVWVTHGVPLNGISFPTGLRMDFTNPLRQICQELEQTQIVVYPVEQSLSGAAAEVGTESRRTLEGFASLTCHGVGAKRNPTRGRILLADISNGVVGKSAPRKSPTRKQST